MGISINTNVAATRAGMFLATNHANLQKSLDRLSSGRRITEPADDAGGLAVSMKLEHSGKVLQGVANNISNAISLLQVQDSALDSIGNIVSRIGELQGMYNDVTKSTADKELYDSEFTDLKAQITAIASNTTFNGINVFGGAGNLEVFLNEDRHGYIYGISTITDVDVDAATDMVTLLADATLADIPQMSRREMSRKLLKK